MIPVEDMRPCPWEGRWMPVNHPCVGDNENAPGPMTRAEGGNPHIKEIEVQQYANPTDNTQVVPLTRSGAKWMQERLAEEEGHISTLDREMAVMVALRGQHQETAARYRASLAPVSLLALVEDPGPELPLEAEAHQAALAEQGRAGEHPYGPPTVTDLPPFNTGHVMVPGEFESQQLADGGVR